MRGIHKHRKIFSSLFLVLFIVGFFAPMTGAVYAQNEAEQLLDQTGTIKTAPGTKLAPELGCGGGSYSFEGCLAAFTYKFLFKNAYRLATLTSIFLNYSLDEFVVTMSMKVDGMDGIDSAWRALRNIGNVFLVFLMVWVGIATILGISSFGYKNLLWRILLAAILINFSITFTKFTIDVGNILTIGMFNEFITTVEDDLRASNYSAALSDDCTNTQITSANPVKEECLINGIAGAFWTQMHLTSFFNTTESMSRSGIQDNPEKQLAMFYTALGGSVMFLIMAFVFGAAAILLVIRFVILIILIILSPVALILWITKVSNTGKDWWGKLLNQSIFPAFMLLMWWVSFKVISEMETVGGDANNKGGFLVLDHTDAGNTIGAIGVFTTFAIAAGFLILSLILAKHLGARGASAMMKTGSSWTKAAAVGTAGFTFAHTAGWASEAAARRHRNSSARAQEVDPLTGNYVNNSLGARFQRTRFGAKVNRGVQNAVAAPSNVKAFKTKSRAERTTGARTAARAQNQGFYNRNRGQEFNQILAAGGAGSVAVQQRIERMNMQQLRDMADDLRRTPALVAHIRDGVYRSLKYNNDGTFTNHDIMQFDAVRIAAGAAI